MVNNEMNKSLNFFGLVEARLFQLMSVSQENQKIIPKQLNTTTFQPAMDG